MKNSHICYLVFFYVLFVSVRCDVVQDSCNKAAKSSPNIRVDFCVSAFAGNPEAKRAPNVAGLVPVSINKAKASATSVVSTISKLLANKKLDKFARSCLQGCSEHYSDAGSSLDSGMEAFESKDYSAANLAISGAMNAPRDCEDQFKQKKGFVSPLTKENDAFFQLSAISLAFINMVNKG